ncbi:tRNA (adenosine(37)-N6)-threonylcarbamoyltransferase complex ATPase subunit type 1 TsaE [Methyloligella sp. 2.7D]|uniref:tRNA (adenosine(37)-N6)-threonylcarbamoyltransferase complex ATPase subunit type 1 TsaE n=1 Tax=unclassified Methyloligella TaxID=2625955 RepID=UPI00157CD5F0|nr:tRNA (adenosine(37)-N6)-threonylcarbamoyltransferase complex ATPase subunit type 1 TsaE [Methyloligella sp. GL2]QKP76055.1 tRNA (adenosine(37)-N6)-threonylcarbamoyltransferase complex ATPase subunit type 1 TsaE [Methyloligella sp. GL2]
MSGEDAPLQWRLREEDLAGLDRLSQYIAFFLRPGDAVALKGPLGAGKTTFTRFLVRALGSTDEVQSPTFGLAQSYETPRFALHHCDFYRLEEGEAEELGLEDYLLDGALIAEWPERAPESLPADVLEIDIAETASPDIRDITLVAAGSWIPRLARLKSMRGFVAETDFSDATLSYMQGDASTRSYARLTSEDRSAILMNAPRTPDGPPDYDGKPYSQAVHLAEDVTPFVAVGEALRARGLAAPEIYAADLEDGFLLLEDLGPRVFGAEFARGESQAVLTREAVDVLLHLAKLPPQDALPVPNATAYALPSFDVEAMLTEVSLLVDWLWPALHETRAEDGKPPADLSEDFLAIWRPLLQDIAADDPGWILRDYHSPNLIWLPERDGLQRVGLLDYQDAMRGPLAYDLVSLLQDARVDVPAALEAELLDYYCASRDGFDSSFSSDRFLRSYALLGAQRASKILGIFARLAKRDGKRGYLAHMPRVAGYLARDLAHPALLPLRDWYARELGALENLPPASL